jgi:hypothetical protein
MLNTESHKNFIDLNWHALLAGAQRGYLQQGRGALIVNIVEMIEMGLNPCALVPYFPDRGTRWPALKVEKLVTEYTPEREIAVVFLCPVEGVVCYRAFADRRQIRLIEYFDSGYTVAVSSFSNWRKVHETARNFPAAEGHSGGT